MSTAITDSKPTRTPVGPGPAFHRVLNSEFIKFRTLLSTLILLASTAVVMVGFAALAAWGTGQFADQAARDPEAAAAMAAQGGDLAVSIPTSGISFAQLILGSLGVLLMSSEFTTGMARSTFAAVPKRLSPFLAKLIVVVVSAFLLTAVATYVAGLVSLPIVDNYNLKLDLGSSQSIKLLLVNSIYVAAVAAIGMALGTIVRNSAGGIMSLVGLLFVAPIAFQLIPGDFFKEANKYLPTSTINPMTAVEHVPDTLEAWQAALVLTAWVVVPVAIAMVLLKKRDV
ncbi:ABC transporter permease [Arthrobacter sp. TES]|uniref:ABC transporter permease n=1 Tax=Paenarthrobacter TaxID=1742992 RepID=UPI000397C758|nr:MULTISPECIES: ABC transporter permease [Paenarthrobacter]AMB42275.1 ABC transporter [Arthrobacter sp. ATCC 21022]AOY73434.1 ABC transporter [Arthrobacter sp. ZXY-2]ERI36804.1 ABC transporter [Arthrobacter sp. AK-YN10]QOI64965.1 ABC transporter permease [Arthrobacter sp. TES]KUR63072.1 ABC transporter [Arthrobacter sp. ATCC 21022]